MPATKHRSTPRGASTRPIILVGTLKGAFILEGNSARSSWTVRGPFFPGQAVYAMAFDARAGRQRVWASAQSFHWGAQLCSSDDLGASWNIPETPAIRFPEGSELALKNIWQITMSPHDANSMFCGVEPSALFESHDEGRSWQPVKGILEHPHRPKWFPGGGGLCLHTIIPDPINPKRMHIAMSTGGVYRTEDGGESWQPRNSGVRAQFLPDKHPEFGQCVHKVVMNPSRPKRLYLQNHWGLYRSDDGGDSWKDIANGVPSDFGFPMAVHPNDPDTAYIIPLKSDEFRVTPEAKLRVYRTRNAGKSWEPMTRGLPQNGAYETVVRDSMATDALDPAGVYFGTRSGKVFGSKNDGTAWSLLVDGLPPVVCIKTGLLSATVATGANPAGPAKSVKPAKHATPKHATPKRATVRGGTKTRARSNARTASKARGGAKALKRGSKGSSSRAASSKRSSSAARR
jgi:photosystem II stability/assembly factor-like uncharacterized protein